MTAKVIECATIFEHNIPFLEGCSTYTYVHGNLMGRRKNAEEIRGISVVGNCHPSFSIEHAVKEK